MNFFVVSSQCTLCPRSLREKVTLRATIAFRNNVVLADNFDQHLGKHNIHYAKLHLIAVVTVLRVKLRWVLVSAIILKDEIPCTKYYKLHV